jgi:hypothetical protein
MSAQARLAAVHIATVLAFERLFVCVLGSDVSVQLFLHNKVFFAHITSERSFPGMNAQMHCQIWLLTEFFSTKSANKSFLVVFFPLM